MVRQEKRAELEDRRWMGSSMDGKSVKAQQNWKFDASKALSQLLKLLRKLDILLPAKIGSLSKLHKIAYESPILLPP